jgi:hypothetical protein
MSWYPASLVLKNLPKPMLVGSGETFVAADPWNGGARSQFYVEFYKIVPKGKSREYGARMAKLHGVDLFNIRSSDGGPSHRLPDSLTDLWCSKRVATEALPRLLHELQPSLRKYDYYRILHHRRFEWAGSLYALFLFGIMIFFLIAVPDGTVGARFVPFSFGSLALGILLVSVVLPRRLRDRFRKQMDWILAYEIHKTDE